MEKGPSSPWLPWYVGSVVAGGTVAIGAAVFTHAGIFLTPKFWLFTFLMGWMEAYSRRVPKGDRGSTELTISTTFAFALLLIAGGAAAIVANAIAALANGVIGRKAWYKTVFNAASFPLAVAASAFTLSLLTSIYTPLGEPSSLFGPIHIPAILAAAGVFLVIDLLVLERVVTLAEGVPMRTYFRRDVIYQGVPMAVMFCVGTLVAIVANHSLWFLPLLAVPVVAGLKMGSVFMEKEHQSLHDALTDLPNRTLFRDRLEQALKGIPRNRTLVGVMVMDLDRFKEVNDALGHPAGDKLLQAVGPRLYTVLRDTDTVGRLGGDEFGVVLRSLQSPEDAALVAEKIQAVLLEPVEIENVSLEIPASIGIVIAPVHGVDAELLIRRADAAMFEAKRSKTGFCIFVGAHNTDEAEGINRLTLSNDLRKAVVNAELVLYYQPKVDIRDGKIIGVEALVRWQHPRFGLLGAADVVPLAEATGLIQQLTMYVIDRALRQISEWRSYDVNVLVSVNISAQNLLNQRLLLRLFQSMDRWNVEPESLILEITETQIMSNPKRSLEMLRALKGMGVHLSVDDFGTGASALSRLKELPVDELKIDRSFIQGLLEDRKDQALTRAIITLGHELGMEVTAEGVEEEEHVAMLLDFGCDIVQGYLISRPLNAIEYLAWHKLWTPGDMAVWARTAGIEPATYGLGNHRSLP